MIAKFWDALFEYGDMLREQGREADHKVLEDVYTILQTVYDKGISSQRVIENKKPDSKIEEFVLSIKDIVVYKDGQDNSFYYDLDGHHFDTPEEVMKYLVDCRFKLQAKAMYKARKEVIEFMMAKLDSLDIPSVVGKTSPKVVQKAPMEQKLTASYLQKELIDKHKTPEQIAMFLGCSESTVRRYIIKYGLNKKMEGRKK